MTVIVYTVLEMNTKIETTPQLGESPSNQGSLDSIVTKRLEVAPETAEIKQIISSLSHRFASPTLDTSEFEEAIRYFSDPERADKEYSVFQIEKNKLQIERAKNHEAFKRRMNEQLSFLGAESMPKLRELISQKLASKVSSFLSYTIPTYYAGISAPLQNEQTPITNNLLPDPAEINFFRYGILPESEFERKRFIQKFHSETVDTPRGELYKLSGNDNERVSMAYACRDKLISVIDSQEVGNNFTTREIPEKEKNKILSAAISRPLIDIYINHQIFGDDVIDDDTLYAISQFNQETHTDMEEFYSAHRRNNFNNLGLTMRHSLSNLFESVVEESVSQLYEQMNMNMYSVNAHHEGLLMKSGYRKKIGIELDTTLQEIQEGEVGVEKLQKQGVIFMDSSGLKGINDLFGHSAGDSLLSMTKDFCHWLTLNPVVIDGNEVSFRHAGTGGADEFILFYESNEAIDTRVLGNAITILSLQFYPYLQDLYNQSSNDPEFEIPGYIKTLNGKTNEVLTIPFSQGSQAIMDHLGDGWETSVTKAKAAGIDNLSTLFDKIKAEHAKTFDGELDVSNIQNREFNTSDGGSASQFTYGFSFLNVAGAATFQEVIDDNEDPEEIVEELELKAERTSDRRKPIMKTALSHKNLLMKTIYSFRPERQLPSVKKIFESFYEKVRTQINIAMPENAKAFTKEIPTKNNNTIELIIQQILQAPEESQASLTAQITAIVLEYYTLKPDITSTLRSMQENISARLNPESSTDSSATSFHELMEGVDYAKFLDNLVFALQTRIIGPHQATLFEATYADELRDVPRDTLAAESQK
jgi:GGDEF domain-containing protein